MVNRAVVVRDVDDVNTWELVIKEKPHASPGHVVVRITVRPVNPSEWIAPKLMPSLLQAEEIVAGNEGFGYVEEVGEGVTKVKVGQRVVPSFLTKYYVNADGSWQDFVELAEGDVHPVSDSISDDIASQYIINPLCYYGLLKALDVPKGEYLLQTAAASSIGRQVIQLAKHWGIRTINIVRRDDVKEELKSLGADEVINSTTEDPVAKVKEVTGGRGAYGAIDCIAGTQTKDVISSVRTGGQVLIYGSLSLSDWTKSHIMVGLMDVGRVEVKLSGGYVYINTPEKFQAVYEEIGKLLEEKVIVPFSGKKFKLEDFKEAIVESRKPGRGGNTSLAIDHYKRTCWWYIIILDQGKAVVIRSFPPWDGCDCAKKHASI